MPSVPDQSSSTAQSTANLEAGLSALKQGDYQTAIAQLTATQLPPDHPLAAKAQMGLVVAYTHVGDVSRAATLCRSLRNSKEIQVSDWATRTLTGLEARHPQLAETLQDTSGQRTEHIPESIPPSLYSPGSEPDLTGFTPFDPAAPPDLSQTDDRSGFAPPAAPPLHAAAFSNDELSGPPTAPQVEDPAAGAPVVDRMASNTEETAILTEGMAMRPKRSLHQNRPTSDRATSDGATLGNRRSPTPPRATIDPSTLLQDQEQPLYQPVWRQAGRLKQGKSLGKVKLWRLLLLQAGTAVALFYLVQAIAYNTTLFYSIALTKIPFLHLSRELFHPSVLPILVFLGVLFVGSRWLLDGLLTIGYGLQPLSLGKLATYSPETAQALQRFCRQQRVPMPALSVLPTAAPIAFSYGCLPHVTRTVVSQGLLEQLADDEIATIFAGEIGHISRWDVPLLSLVTVLVQIPYTVYWLVSDWGNRKQAAISRGSATVLAAISYGVYALLRWVALWLSRQRTYYSDRVAVELTGNPNGFTRALLKIAIGTAKEVQTQTQTSYLLEGFDLLTPLGHRMATTLGSVYPYVPIESVLEWERTNPYRHWLAINNSHPPTGDRLNLLTLYARHWKLDTELDWGSPPRSTPGKSTVSNQPKSKLTSRQWRSLLLQGAPFFGLALGFATAYLFNGLGWIGFRSNIGLLSWMYGDNTLVEGLPLVGFSIGTFIRINPLFPDLPFSSTSADSSVSLLDVLQPASQIPIDRQPVRLEGQFLGRPGISNLLSQDLLLQTATGIVRLHCLSPWGPIDNLLPQAIRPVDLLKQEVVVTGWFRRGATPWIDVDTIRTPGGRVSRSGHPVWSTILGAITAAWGIYIIVHGDIFL